MEEATVYSRLAEEPDISTKNYRAGFVSREGVKVSLVVCVPVWASDLLKEHGRWTIKYNSRDRESFTAYPDYLPAGCGAEAANLADALRLAVIRGALNDHFNLMHSEIRSITVEGIEEL